METMRKPFQGVVNIVRFNWHFYALTCGFLFILLFAANYCEKPYTNFIYLLSALAVSSMVISLLISFYVYDLSGLYRLNWIEQNGKESIVVNINAGFDETSYLLQNKFNQAKLIALDFYNVEKHTEVSIKRARMAYPPYPNTRQIITSNIKFADNSADKIIVILSAHEIRNADERSVFFKELNRILKPDGQIYVTEHLRDFSNFLAYTIGFFHFYSKATWLKTYQDADLKVAREIKLTPFISTFILNKNGNTL